MKNVITFMIRLWNDYDKNKKSSYLQFWNVNNLYGWAVLQKLSVNVLDGLNVHLNLMKIS